MFRKETVEQLLNVMFDDLHAPYADSSVVNGIVFLGSLIETKRSDEPNDGMEEIILPIDQERLTKGSNSILRLFFFTS